MSAKCLNFCGSLCKAQVIKYKVTGYPHCLILYFLQFIHCVKNVRIPRYSVQMR